MAALGRQDHARPLSLVGLRDDIPGHVPVPIRSCIFTSEARSSPANLTPKAPAIVPSPLIRLCGYGHCFTVLAALLPYAQVSGLSVWCICTARTPQWGSADLVD